MQPNHATSTTWTAPSREPRSASLSSSLRIAFGRRSSKAACGAIRAACAFRANEPIAAIPWTTTSSAHGRNVDLSEHFFCRDRHIATAAPHTTIFTIDTHGARGMGGLIGLTRRDVWHPDQSVGDDPSAVAKDDASGKDRE